MITFLFAFAIASTDVTEIQIRHTSPSKVAEALRSMTDLYEVRTEVDDDRGLLRLIGTEHGRKEVAATVNLVDVKPRSVRLSFEVESQIDHRIQRFVIESTNNSRAVVMFDSVGLGCEVTPRINMDGTLTCMLLLKYRGKEHLAVVRAENGKDQWAMLLRGSPEIAFGVGRPPLDSNDPKALLSLPKVKWKAEAVSDERSMPEAEK